MVGPRGLRMKGFCPPTRPPTCPHERTFAAGGSSARSGTASLNAEAGSARRPPPNRVVEVEPPKRIVRDQQVAVEVDPVGERGDDRRRGDPDGGLFHTAEERSKTEPARLGEHRPGRA